MTPIAAPDDRYGFDLAATLLRARSTLCTDVKRNQHATARQEPQEAIAVDNLTRGE